MGPAVFLGLLVVWPLIAVLSRSLTGVGPARVVELALRPSTLSVVGFTVGQAAVSTVLTLAVGLPVAGVLARYRFPGRRVLRVVVLVPFVLPTVVVGSAFVSVFDRVGIESGSLAAVLSAHVFFNLAVVVRIVGGFWASTDRRLEDAARVLGAGRWQTLRHVTLARLAPVVTAAAVLVFLFSFTSFGIIRILGGPAMATIETEIFRYAVRRVEFDVAATLALLQLAAVVMLAWLSARFQRQLTGHGGAQARPLARRPATFGQWTHVLAAIVVVVVVVVAPMAVLVDGSLRTADGYGIDHYRRLFTTGDLLPVSAAEAVARSLVFAVVAAAVATVVGLSAAVAAAGGGRAGRLLEALTLVPLGVSAVTLGFGYLLAFAAFDLRRSTWLVPVAHAVIGLPFVLAAVGPALRSIDPRLREAAQVLGANPPVVRARIDWPLIRGAVVTGAGFAAAVSVGEFGATSFLARGADSFTAPLAVFRLVSQPGPALRGQALALSVVIGLVVAVIAAVIEWRRASALTLL